MDTFEEFVEILNGKTASSYSRRNAISSLGRLGDERAVDPLVSVFQDEDRYIRSEAAKALGEMKFSSAIKPLIEALKDPDDHVRRAAIVALGILGDENTIEPLRGMLKDQSYFTRSEAEKSIKQIEERLEEPELIEEEAKAEPEPEPTPPLETEMTKEIIQEPEDVVGKEPEISPPDEAPEATAMRTMEISDADRSKLRGKIFEHQTQKAAKFADQIKQQKETEDQSSSVFFDMLDRLVSVEKRSRRKPAIIGIIAVFVILNVITRGAIFPLAMIAVPIGLMIWFRYRRKNQGASEKTMDLLLKGLRSDDLAIRAISARILGDSGDERAIRPLWEAVEAEQDLPTKNIMEQALINLGQ